MNSPSTQKRAVGDARLEAQPIAMTQWNKALQHLGLTILLVLGFTFRGHSQPHVTTLSPEATVSVLTCAPGSEIYSIFGHSALRIQDPATRLNWVWNYGIFDFETPNFTLKFAQGKLLYYVASQSYMNFYPQYEEEGRSIYAQTLRLSEPQKKALFDALLVNELPENRAYQYDFFYDNCATRERDILIKSMGQDLRFHPPQPDDFGTYRELIDGYLRNNVWADFGIDLILGSPTDLVATQQGAMFLPDYLMKALATAEVRIDGQWQPLVTETKTLLDIPRQPVTTFQYGPHILGWGIFALTLLVTFWGFRSRKTFKVYDSVLFLILGMLGTMMLLFWVATDHQAAYWNYNMLWAVPFHLVFALANPFARFQRFCRAYVKIMFPFSLGFLAVSWLLPQGFHAAVIPIAMAATVRFAWNWYRNRKS